jgi:CelD/BcsL family acetyltransferase involved in cellulose biosynthesis
VTATTNSSADLTVRAATPQEWDDAWSSCEYATFFHSREWAAIWESYSGGKLRPEPLHVTLPDGTTAILPLARERRAMGLLVRTHSSPVGTYGGWLSAAPLAAANARGLAQLLHGMPNLYWRLNPFDPSIVSVELPGVRTDTTHAIDLSGGADAVEQKWKTKHSSHLRNVRKAERAEISVEMAQDEQAWNDYFGVYRGSVERWGESASSVYRRDLFDRMFAQKSKHTALWVARADGRVVAGALCFYASQHAVYWHGAASESHFEARPVNLLMATIVRDACKRGMRWFDLNPSGGHEGVERFKRSIGAQRCECPVVTTTTALMRLAQSIRKKR